MRILQVTDWNPSPGGSEAYVAWLLAALPRAGHDVRLLTSNAGSAADGNADFVAPASRHPAAQVFLQVINPFAYATGRRALREFQPDLVHVHLFAYHLSPAVLRAFGKTPFLLTVHDYKPICPTGTKLLPNGRLCTTPAGPVCRDACLGNLHWLRDQVRYAFIRKCLPLAAATHVCSETMATILRAHGTHPTVLPIPVPVDTTGFVHQPAAHPHFVCVSRLEPEKGVELLLHAFARVLAAHPTARLRIVGDGSLRPSLQALAHSLAPPQAIEFTGRQPGSAINRWLTDAWALVAPSLWAEPFGLVAPEAILRGIPVVCSRTGGLAESVVPGESGLLFDNGNADQLLAHLDAIASRRVFPRQECSADAVRSLRERHDPDLHLTRLTELYRAVSAGTGG